MVTTIHPHQPQVVRSRYNAHHDQWGEPRNDDSTGTLQVVEMDGPPLSKWFVEGVNQAIN